MDPIEVFLRNALRVRAMEDRQVDAALRALRPLLARIGTVIDESGVMGLGITREATIQQLSDRIAAAVSQQWGQPLAERLGQDLAPFVDEQQAFARRLVEASGGTLARPGAAAGANVPAIVGAAVTNGKPLAQTLAQVVPQLVADRSERYMRMGLTEDRQRTYGDAVVRVTEGNVEALIRTGVGGVADAAQALIYEVETDPDWLEGAMQWVAILDPKTCPVCIGMDGKTLQLGEPAAYWDGRNKLSPHPQCRCYVVPKKWTAPDRAPDGTLVPPQREAIGDRGEQNLGYRQAARKWLADNPETTRSIFGKKLGNQLLSGEIGFDRAVRLWNGAN